MKHIQIEIFLAEESNDCNDSIAHIKRNMPIKYKYDRKIDWEEIEKEVKKCLEVIKISADE